LEYQNQELSKKIERLENEMLSLKASLTSMTERTEIKTNRPTPIISTPMATPMYKSDEDWTHHPLAPSMSARDPASTSRVGNPVRKTNLYDGQTSWEAYYAQFCIIAEMNGWDDMEKAAFLATSLKGTALQVLANLSNDRRQDYRALVTALASRFGTSHRTEISKVKFKNRVRQRDEGLPALAEDIEGLARLAYADAPPTIIDTLARDQFVDSLPDDDMRLRLRQERPQTLQRALELALELESFLLANRQKRMRVSRETKVQSEFTPRGTTASTLDIAKRMEAASNQIAQSMKKLEALMRDRRNVSQKSPRNKEPRDLKCWKCGGEGNFRHECPKRSPARDFKNTNDESARDGVPTFAGKETRTGEASKGNLGNAV
jgi:hypothetical protein